MAANPGAARSGTITIADQTFTVEPGGRSVQLLDRSDERELDGTGGSGTVDVTAESWCAWTATSNDLPWLTVTSGSPGTGNGSVGYSVAANTAGARTGTITIADQTFTVNQAPLSDRELAHGSDAWQSLAAVGGVAHVDYYRLAQQPYSSYEVVVEGDSGDVQPVELDRLAADNATVLAARVAGDRDWAPLAACAGATAREPGHDAVDPGSQRRSCSTDCGADDTYRIRCLRDDRLDPALQQLGLAGDGGGAAEPDGLHDQRGRSTSGGAPERC